MQIRHQHSCYRQEALATVKGRSPCPLRSGRLRLSPGAAATRVCAVLEDPRGAPGGPSGSGGGGRPARQASIRWARRQRMLPSEPRPGAGEDDLIELNVGGRLMQTTRSTLQQVSGSRLASMFRKGAEAELAYDTAGRVWLDLDPTLFQLVLRYLREVKMSGGHRRGSLPAVKPADEAPFRRLLSYLGLLPYAGATIPIALWHDPLTDELLSSPQLSTPAGPQASSAAASPKFGAQAPSAPQQQQQQQQQQQRSRSLKPGQHQHHQQPQSRRSNGRPDRSAVLGAGQQQSCSGAKATAEQQQMTMPSSLDAGSGSAGAPGRTSRSSHQRGNGSGGGGSQCNGSISTSSSISSNRTSEPGSQQQCAASAAAPSGQAETGSPQQQQQHPHHEGQSHVAGSSAKKAPSDQPHHQPHRRHHHNHLPHQVHPQPQSPVDDGAFLQPSVPPAAQLESEDLIPDTATCSILSESHGAQGGRKPPQRRQPPASRAPAVAAGGRTSGATSGGPQAAPGSAGAPDCSSSSSSTSGGGADGGNDGNNTVAKLSPPPVRSLPGVSQLFYIATDYSEARGLRVSVYTEDDIRSGFALASTQASGGGGNGVASNEPFDIFVDTTYSESQLSMTFVSRRQLLPGGVFLGLTSRAQLDRKGGQIPCYGWKSNGCTYNDHTGGGRLGGSRPGVAAGAGLNGAAGGRAARGTAAAGPGGCEGCGASQELCGEENTGATALWKKGDSVELIMRQGQQHNQLLLKVNGQAIDVINRLPSFRNWSWYVGLWAGGDISCAVFQRDQYAVYWGDYAVKRYM